MITGGAGGIEASLVLLLVVVVPALALTWYATATGRMRRPVATSAVLS